MTSIGKHAFEVSSLASITIPNSVTSIGDTAFSSCINLKSVSLPSSLKNIGKNVFMWSDSIADITLNCDIDVSDADLHIIKDGIKYVVQDKKSVKIMSDYGYEERKVLDPYSDPDNPDYYLEVVLEKRCPKNPIITILETINAGDTFTVTSIDSEAFEGCGELTSVTIPNSVTEIGDYAFSGVKNIVYDGSATGSPWGAKMINGYVDGDLLYSDETKTNLVGCSKYAATDVIIPNTVTSINDYAFYRCSKLTSITLPSSLTSIGSEAFGYCYGLSAIYYTGNIAEWCRITFENQPLVYANNLYINNSLVTDLVIPENITEIKDNAFSGATCMTSVTIHNSVTSIGNYAFWGCSLTSITIPNSVTRIGDGVFLRCGGLTSVTSPIQSLALAEEHLKNAAV